MQLQLYGNKIWLFRKPIDFRCGMDGLSNLIMMELKQKPREGIFIFYNRNRDKLKCLSWHKNGFILLYKRLEQGRFNFHFNKALGACEMNIQELSWALAGLEWQKMREWRDLDYDKFS